MARLLMSGLFGLPDESIPWNRAVHCGPAARNVSVWLLGGGPGLNVDFARLSSHVPTWASFCAEMTDAKAAIRPSANTTGVVHPTSETLITFMARPTCSSQEGTRMTVYLIWISTA